jgi:hypothetical protein
MNFAHVNLLSILVAAVAAWIFGGIYYTALSKPWMAAQGKTLEQCKAEQDAKSILAKEHLSSWFSLARSSLVGRSTAFYCT